MDAFTKAVNSLPDTLTGPLAGHGVETVLARFEVPPGPYLAFAKATAHQITPGAGLHLRLVLADEEDRADVIQPANDVNVALMVAGTFTGGREGEVSIQSPRMSRHIITLYGQAFNGEMSVQNIRLMALGVDNLHKN
jgi:hypothetical protein